MNNRWKLYQEQDEDRNLQVKTRTITKTILHIKINSKSLDDVKQTLSKKQIAMVDEICKDEYLELWNELLNNSGSGSTDLVQIAKSFVGIVGRTRILSGGTGFKERVSWCACFVSYCLNKAGLLEQGKTPKFASCESEGVSWFKTCNLWQERDYIPNSGDIIFFDWENDGHSDHVGIVEKIEKGYIYTIKGNTNR